MYKSKIKKSMFDLNKSRFKDMLKKRHVDNKVEITKHFIERFMLRNEDVEFHLDAYKAIQHLANNICQYIFDFELGNKPSVIYNDIRIEMLYNGDKIFLSTIYRR